MRLRARVRRTTGSTRHVIHGAEAVDLALQVAWVDIERADSGWFLLYRDASGECLADTWHERVELAMAQARAEFAVDATDWENA